MDSTLLQADRVLLPVFVTVLVGFVTAALSIVRLVNDKEGKTSDHRQHWCDSLRVCLADLVSSINSAASEIVNRAESGDRLSALLAKYKNHSDKWLEADATLRDHLNEVAIDKDSKVRELRKQLYHAYSLTSLHFKPGDSAFAPIEANFTLTMQLMRELALMNGSDKSKERIERRNEIHKAANAITVAGQEVLKTEWEIVKRGEGAYVLTKKWSVVGGAVAFAILIFFALLAALSVSKSLAPESNKNRSDQVAEAKPPQTVTGQTLVPNAAGGAVTQIVNVHPSECHPPPRTNPPSPQKPSRKSECDANATK